MLIYQRREREYNVLPAAHIFVVIQFLGKKKIHY